MSQPVDPVIGMQGAETPPIQPTSPAGSTTEAQQIAGSVSSNITGASHISTLDQLRKKAPEVYKEIEKSLMFDAKRQMDRHEAKMKAIRRQYERGG